MHDTTRLFDPEILARRRQRADRLGNADFLHEAAAAEISERLKEINRSYLAPALIGPRGDLWQHLLAAALDGPPHLCADRDILDLAPARHDLIVHHLGLHWANDPVGQMVQARRALRPDGLFLAALFGGATLAELRESLAAAETEVSGGLSPRIAPMAGIRDLGALLQRAGFALPVADSLRFDVLYANPFDLMRDLRAMGETNAMHERLRRPTRRAIFTRAAAHYAVRLARPDGRIPATFEIIFLTGWAPSADQPKPLRPGSARARLADALGVPERSAGEKPGSEGV
ncbi:SAM-dependent methyltransferase [Amaricoccus sp.]|uniref:SAM-dependent methyltransferase n=1 Tax=Amaricoccus sp. TaxID=1872485 RepID=UPI002CC60BE3|nr:SAM-dependent methyltransferase [Amaricoccus sp.]HMQ92090.1 SAM-dependent methyltransferase [Amaricoccus sp.]